MPAILFLALLFTVGCAREHALEEKVKIGVSLPLSGNLSNFGQAELIGFKLAFKERKEVQLLIEDNKGDSKEAAMIANYLISTQRPTVFYSAFTHLVAPISKPLGDRKIPLFYSSISEEFLKQNENAFLFDLTYRNLAEEVIKHLINGNLKNGVIISEKAEACDLIIDYMKQQLKGASMFIHEEYYLVSELDLRSVILKIKGYNPEFVFACSFRSQRPLLKALYEGNLNNLPLIQAAAYVGNDVLTEELRNLYRKFNTISAWYGISPGDIKKTDPELFNELKEELGSNPQFMEAFIAYELGRIVGELISACGADRECITTKAKKTVHDTAFGKVSFGEERAIRLPAKMVTPEEFYRDYVVN